MSSGELFKFGEPMVLAEPSWYQFFESPYYEEKHRKWRAKLRAWIDTNIIPFVDEWEDNYTNKPGYEMPLDWMKRGYQDGIFSPMWPEKYGGTPPEGGWDAFMDLIWNDETSRSRCSGVTAGFGIITMALPLLLNSGNEFAINKVAREVITAEKVIALCVTEPYAGSDVANIKATAKKEGDFYILNGEKKWITLGIFAHYFIVAARTGEDGAKGISLFLVEKNMEGVSTRRMRLQGHWLAGTAMVLFNNVKVPKSHLLGAENKGFRQIMHNFNHERYVIAVQGNRGSRALLHASMDYATKRKTFGKKLIEHQVIRQKIADMAMRIESTHALIENVTYQMHRGVPQERLGGTMALLKVFSTRTMEFCVREASQIFGGLSFTRGGVGGGVERAARELRGAVVPGGSDEILADLAVRQAMMLTMKYRMEKQANL